MINYIEEIKKLKKENDVIILAHNYQLPEIQDIADYIGDSLELSKKSANISNRTILFCGVKFMAETAKILSPEKRVLLPVKTAGCEMADMVTKNRLFEYKEKYPDASIVSYVNTTAEIKAYSDICCTSSNAIKIVQSMNTDKILFVPDKNLASFVAKHTDKQIIPFDGHCYVHNQFSIMDIEMAKRKHPNAKIFIHPESPSEVVEYADYVLSTGGMIKKAGEINSNEIIIGTEEGMIYRLQTLYKNKKFYPLREAPPAVCYNMKKTHIEDVYNALVLQQYEIEIEENIRIKAFNAIKNMLDHS